jgi:hypothetical protein
MLCLIHFSDSILGGRRGRDRMVIGFTTTYAYIIPIPSQPVSLLFLLNAACLAEKQQILLLESLV